MGLDTSKISLQGLGVLNANATMVSGSAPSTTFNVIVSISAVDPKWTTEGLTLSNVSSVSGQSTFLITSKPGFQISSSFFNYNPDVAEVSTLFSSINFTNTTNNLDTNNQVLVTINWITQSITSDTNIVLSNIQIQQPTAGNLLHEARVAVFHGGNVDIYIETSFTEEILNTGEDVYLSLLQGLMVENETALVGKVYITPTLNGGAFVGPPNCFVSGPGSDSYNLQTYYEYNQQVVEIFATPTLELSQDNQAETISITSTQYQNSFETQNLNGVATSQFSIPDEDQQTSEAYQELEVKIIGNYAILAGWEVYNNPYDGETGATWIPDANIEWDESTNILKLRVNNNSGAERQAVINLFSTVNGNIPLGSFFVTQTKNSFLSIDVVSSSANVPINFDGSSIDFPITGGSLTILAVIEDYNVFTNTAGLVTALPTSDSITNGNDNTDWFTFGDGNLLGNSVAFACTISGNTSYGNGTRELTFTVKHPLDSSLTKSINITQARAYDPSVDTLDIYSIANPSTNEDVSLEFEGISGTNNYYVQGTVANADDLSVPGESPLTTHDAVLQMDFGGAALIDTPTVLLRYINSTGSETTVLPGGEINNSFFGFNQWAEIVNIDSIGISSNFQYDYFALINIQDNDSYYDTRQVVAEVYHPNSLVQDLVSAVPVRSLTITQQVKSGAFFIAPDTTEHVFDILTDNTSETFSFNMFSSNGLPVVRLESTETFNYPNGEPTVNNQSNIVFHILNGDGSTGNTDGLINSFTQAAGAAAVDSTLTVNISQNTVQEFSSNHIRFKQHIFKCWPNGTTVEASQVSNNPITYTTQPSSTLIINQYALTDPQSIELTGFMASLLSDGDFTPAAYSMSGQYNYTQLSTVILSLFYRPNKPQSAPTFNGGVAGMVNLHNGHQVSNQLSYNSSFNNAICMVIGLETSPSYEAATIEFVNHRYHEADGSIITATGALLSDHFTSFSIVTDSSGQAWSSQGDFDKYIKINLSPKSSFSSGGKTVDNIETVFKLRIGDNFTKQLRISTKMT